MQYFDILAFKICFMCIFGRIKNQMMCFIVTFISLSTPYLRSAVLDKFISNLRGDKVPYTSMTILRYHHYKWLSGCITYIHDYFTAGYSFRDIIISWFRLLFLIILKIISCTRFFSDFVKSILHTSEWAQHTHTKSEAILSLCYKDQN